MYVCMYVCIRLSVCMYECVRKASIYVCMYVCMYIHIHTYNVCMHVNLRCIDEIAVLIHNIMRIIRIIQDFMYSTL